MVARDTQADLAVDFEAAGGCEEAEGGGSERVGRWEGYAAMVDAGAVGGWRGRAGEGEVPVVEVCVGDGGGVEMGGWGGG